MSAIIIIARTYYTLISCLPNDSKEILSKNGIIISKNGIIISTPTSKYPIFNYAAFCKFLIIHQVDNDLEILLKDQQSISKQDLADKKDVLVPEITKLFVKHSSLKNLTVLSHTLITSYPEAKDCLKNLSKLCCDSDINSEFFCHLSQICYNIQSLSISFKKIISNGLGDLISAQNNLKCFKDILK